MQIKKSALLYDMPYMWRKLHRTDGNQIDRQSPCAQTTNPRPHITKHTV
jgi:hypothetical protein